MRRTLLLPHNNRIRRWKGLKKKGPRVGFRLPSIGSWFPWYARTPCISDAVTCTGSSSFSCMYPFKPRDVTQGLAQEMSRFVKSWRCRLNMGPSTVIVEWTRTIRRISRMYSQWLLVDTSMSYVHWLWYSRCSTFNIHVHCPTQCNGHRMDWLWFEKLVSTASNYSNWWVGIIILQRRLCRTNVRG